MSDAIVAMIEASNNAIQPEKKKGPGRPKDEVKAAEKAAEKAAKALQREQEKIARALLKAAEKAAKPIKGPGRPKDPAKEAAREQAKAEKAILREQKKAERIQRKAEGPTKTILIPQLIVSATTDEELRAENAMLREKLGQILFVLQSLQ